MGVCDTCEHAGNCKSEDAVRQLERLGSVGSCSGFKREEDKINKHEDFKMALKQAFAKEKNTWIVTENGCVITCPKCGERLELCYPDGTEVRYLPHCPWCGKKLEESV